MTSDLDALYRDVILDHNRRPRNRRALADGRKAEGSNPLCGDQLTVYVRVEDGVIQEATFDGFGCAIATASASLMTESVTGRTVAEAGALLDRLRRMLAGAPDEPADELGALSALAGVRRFPVRKTCAALPWQTLDAALAGRDDVVSTE